MTWHISINLCIHLQFFSAKFSPSLAEIREYEKDCNIEFNTKAGIYIYCMILTWHGHQAITSLRTLIYPANGQLYFAHQTTYAVFTSNWMIYFLNLLLALFQSQRTRNSKCKTGGVVNRARVQIRNGEHWHHQRTYLIIFVLEYKADADRRSHSKKG